MKLARILSISSIVLGTAVLLLTTRKGSQLRSDIADKSVDLWNKMRKMPNESMKRMGNMKQQAADMMA